MPRTPDFFAHLDAAELNALEAFAREPKHGIRHCHEWIEAKGIVTSRSAVGRWFKRFRETDRLSEAAELADAIHSASADAGAVDVAGAVNLQLAQRLQAALVKGGDKLAMGDLLKGAMAVNALTNAQGKINEMRRAQADAVKAAEAAAASGQSGVDVVATIKQALGIAA
jgi:hypothetical protein